MKLCSQDPAGNVIIQEQHWLYEKHTEKEGKTPECKVPLGLFMQRDYIKL